MNGFHKYPFVRILSAFAFGIILSFYLNKYQFVSETITLWISFILFIAIIILDKFFNYKNKFFFGITVFFLILLVGFSWHTVYVKYQLKSHFQNVISNEEETFIAECIEKPIQKENSYKTIVQVKFVSNSSNEFMSCKGKALIYFEKDNLLENIQYGDVLVFSAKPKHIAEPKNPAMFNYKKYLNTKFIYHYFYLRTGDYKVTEKRYFSFKSLSQQLRRNLIRTFEDKGLRERQLSLLSALAFGYDHYLTEDVKLQFSNAGAMHILCVSGLHVGIIYLVISFMISLIPIKNKWFKIFKVILTLFFMWIFTFITGLGDAAVRATIMLSLFEISKLFDRKYSSLNILAISAFLMLLYNPNSITYVSFQLSYIAVFGILWLYPYINKWWNPKSLLLKYIWSLIAVSLSAQFILYPVLIYYFHKVSVLFLLTNLIVIPLATIILYLTLAFIVLAQIEIISSIIIKLLNTFLLWLEEGTTFIANIKFSYLDRLWINAWQMLLFYLLIIFSATLLIKNKKYIVHTLLMALLFFFIILTSNRNELIRYNKIIFYQVKKGMAIDFICNSKSIFIADSSIINDKKMINYEIRNYWESHYMRPEIVNYQIENTFEKGFLLLKKPYIQFQNKTIYVVDKHNLNYIYSPKMDIDFLVINTPNLKSIQKTILSFNIKDKIILTGNVPQYTALPIIDSLKQMNIPTHYTFLEGALIYNIPKN